MKKSQFTFLFVFLCQLVIAQQTSEIFVAKPYLQIGRNPSPESLQLLWHSPDANADWTVEFRADSRAAWVKAPVPSSTRVAVGTVAPHRVYIASLTGLKPGSNFLYRVLKDGKEVFAAEAKTMRAADQPYRFVTFADIGAESAPQRALAKRAYLEKPDVVIVPGDIVYEHGTVAEYQTKFWPVYNADKPDTMGGPLMRSVPFIVSPGNHDTDARDLDKYPDGLAYFYYWNQPLNGPDNKEGGALTPALIASDEHRKPFMEGAGDNYPRLTNYSFDYGNAHWTVLDSNPYVDFTDQALHDWVAKDLASPAAQRATWRFIMIHHPGFNSSREHYEQQQMRLLVPEFEAGKVDIVFSGHVHNYQRTFPMKFVPDRKGTLLVGGRDNKTVRGRIVNGAWTLDKNFDGITKTKPNGIVYLITGAGGQDLYNPEQNNDPDSWQKFTNKFRSNVHSLTVADVNDKTITIRQITSDGKEIDSFKITK
jgi:predicted phosphodiesterase